jgi:hypothetical protein
MMRKTHRAFAVVFWLGSTLTVDALAVKSGHEAPFSPAVVAAGPLLAMPFSAGAPKLTKKFGLSPDMDQMWAPGPPRNHYDWRYHRGFTHRVWFASLLSLLFGIAPFLALCRQGLPIGVASLALAPANGWWSHLAGDCIYGRIKFGIWTKAWDSESRRTVWRWWHWNIGLGWKTGGASESGGKFLRDPAAKVCIGLSVALTAAHLVFLVA